MHLHINVINNIMKGLAKYFSDFMHLLAFFLQQQPRVFFNEINEFSLSTIFSNIFVGLFTKIWELDKIFATAFVLM